MSRWLRERAVSREFCRKCQSDFADNRLGHPRGPRLILGISSMIRPGIRASALTSRVVAA
jgi:hypothetical protein